MFHSAQNSLNLCLHQYDNSTCIISYSEHHYASNDYNTTTRLAVLDRVKQNYLSEES